MTSHANGRCPDTQSAFLPQRAAAPVLPWATRSAFVSIAVPFLTFALPPFLPRATAAGFFFVPID